MWFSAPLQADTQRSSAALLALPSGDDVPLGILPLDDDSEGYGGVFGRPRSGTNLSSFGAVIFRVDTPG